MSFNAARLALGEKLPALPLQSGHNPRRIGVTLSLTTEEVTAKWILNHTRTRNGSEVRLAFIRLGAFIGILFLAGCTSVQTKIEIEAPAKDVRAVLLNFGDYPKWNPFIVRVDGTVAEGSTVRVTVKPVGKDALSGDTVVTSLTDTRLAWTGSLAIPGLFRGNHEFIIEGQGPKRTMFYQNEKMSGIIIPFVNFKPEAEGFVLMNEALKKRAEKSGD